MKNCVLLVLAVVFLSLSAAPAHAGIAVKKQIITHRVAENASVSLAAENAATQYETVLEACKDAASASPSGLFIRWLHNGTIGLFAFLFGILGLLSPVFALGGVLFGFLGMKKWCSSKGLAIAGFVLGLVAIFIAVFGVYTPVF